ncbi:MAG: NAD(P)/FAD-dependent oxidoreductase [Pseudomonadales bacterium]
MSKILILGGGFAGLWAALAAAREVVEHAATIPITLVSQDEYLTIRPRLYEKNPQQLRIPLRPILDLLEIEFVQGVVRTIDSKGQMVDMERVNGVAKSLPYDRLILATGSELRELPIPGMLENGFNIDTYSAAVALDQHLRKVIKKPYAPGNDTIVIVGAGFTGIELATEMRRRLKEYADDDAVSKVRIVLVERSEVVAPDLGVNPRPVIEAALQHANVEVILSNQVHKIDPDNVTMNDGETIQCCTTILTAGLRASSLAAAIPIETDKLGRIPVDEMLRVRGLPNVFATGDIACAYADHDHLALMSCQHALTMGKFAGYNAARQLLDLPLRPYVQTDYVTCLDLGDSGAVFTTGWDRRIQMTGEKAKQLKRTINTKWIYPPQNDRTALLSAANIDAGHRSS